MIYQFIHDGEINISPEDWLKLNIEFPKEEIIDFLVEAVLNKQIDLPLVKISREEAIEDFKKLVELDTASFFQEGKIFTKYDYKYPIANKYIRSPLVGSKASNYFHQLARFKCDSITAPSPFRTWQTEKFLRTLFPALWSLKCKEVNTQTLRIILSLRKYVASQFKPCVAKAIYDHFDSKVVLDFSAGWGDRLCGFCASNAKEYWGIDPSKETFGNYLKQLKMYAEFIYPKEVNLINTCAEDTELPENYFDTVFTSPPYYNMERYDSSPDQSFKRYRKFDDWMKKFLFVALDNAWKSLKNGGIMAINISDVYSNHTVNQICDAMNDHIKDLGGTFKGNIGLALSKRPNAKSMKGKIGSMVEPIWVWEK